MPDEFGVGVTTPIPKSTAQSSTTTSADYRGITIHALISKLVELGLLDEFSSVKTSDRQFGFKTGVGCINSIHFVRKVINYFNLKKSTVNVGVIDLRKAFDKVNVFGWLCLLHETNINKQELM